MTHHIRKQILMLDLDREHGREVLQRRVSAAYQERVLPALDRLFSQIAPEGRVVRLDRLEVDLGDLEDRNWEVRFVDRCVEYVAKQVSEAAFSVATTDDRGVLLLDHPQKNWEVLSFYLEYGVMPWYAQDYEIPEMIKTLLPDIPNAPGSLKPLLQSKFSARQRFIHHFDLKFVEPLLEQVFQFNTGWIDQAKQIRESQTNRPISKRENFYLLEKVVALSQSSSSLILPEKAVISHLFYQLDLELGLMPNIPKNTASDPGMSISTSNPGENAAETTPNPISQLDLEHGLMSNTPKNTASDPGISISPSYPGENAAETTQNPISQVPSASKESTPAPTNRSNAPDTPVPTDPAQIGPLSDSAPTRSEENKSLPSDRANTPIAPMETESLLLGNAASSNTATDVNPTHARRKPSTVFEKGIWVNHAGLVLLSPYLPAFFNRLGINPLQDLVFQTNTNGVQINPDGLKALHLLHFLASSTENPAEHQLAIPKILCGFLVETLILTNINVAPPEQQSASAPDPMSDERGDLCLSEDEIKEAFNLLQAVIDNWPVLKNTTPEGLQTGFLNRPGLLCWEDDRQSWVLKIERQAFDILLDRLPWGYSVIKLPWMHQMLQVEW